MTFSWRWWALCLVGLTLVLYWRRPDAFYNPQFWAEDGAVFMYDATALHTPLMERPYAGYHHVMARLVAYIGTWLPLRYVPHWYYLTSWLLLAALATYVFSARFNWSNWQRCLLGLALVAVPMANEVFFNLANWATLMTLWWLLLAGAKEPRTPWEILFDFGVLTLAGLNSPFTICLWPIFWLRWATRRTPMSGGLALASLFVAGCQVFNMTTRLNNESTTSWWPMGVVFVDAVLYHFGFMFWGAWVYGFHLSDPLRLAGLAGIAVFYGGLLARSATQRQWAVWTWLWSGLMSGLLSLFVQRFDPPAALVFEVGRHFYLPAVTLTWALIALPGWRRWLPLGLIAGAFFFATPMYKQEIFPDLHWAEQVTACEIASPNLCEIPINPSGWMARFPPPPRPPVTGPYHIYLPEVQR